MSAKTPRLSKLSVNVAIGATTVYKDDQVGVQRSIFLPRGVMEQNPFLRFGPTGHEFQINTSTGVWIQFDDDFDELSIRVPSTASGAAIGDVLMAGCGFIMQSV